MNIKKYSDQKFRKLILESNEYIFHAGTKKSDNLVLSNGGRVLNFVKKSSDFKTSRDKNNQINRPVKLGRWFL